MSGGGEFILFEISIVQMKQQSFGVTLWVSNLNFNKYSFSETLIIGWLMSICECTIVVGNWVFKFMELLKCLNLLEIHWFFWLIFFGFLSYIFFFYIYKKKKNFLKVKKKCPSCSVWLFLNLPPNFFQVY